jgi:uncharacterized protein (AIM24 family)
MNHTLEHRIIGETAQVLEINLAPDQSIIADGGALLYLDEEIEFKTKDTDGADELSEKGNSSINGQDDDELPDLSAFEKPSKQIVHDFEEDEEESSLLEKIWTAAKKAITPKKPTKKETEEDDDDIPDLTPLKNESQETKKFQDESNEPEFSWYITHFTNQSEYIRKVGFTTSNSGVVVRIDLDDMLDHELIVQTGTFLCMAKGNRLEKFLDTGVSVNFTKEKFFNLDKASGTGDVFLQAEGHFIQRELENDAIRVNLFSLIAYESSLELDLKNMIKVQSMKYEDETQFALLVGTGKYWLQTANIQQLVYRISPYIFESEEESLPAQKSAVVDKEAQDEIDLDALLSQKDD